MPPEYDVQSLSIITFPHPALRYVAKPIRRVDAQLKAIVARMFELMYAHRGVGLAATQVDLPIRLFVMNSSGRQGEGVEQVVINPVITRPRSNDEAEEGCLSLPNVHGNVVRAKSIHLHAFDLQGREIDEDVDGFEARIIQHETDHLDGTLFIDRLKEGAASEISSELEALNVDFRSRQRTEAVPPDEVLIERLLQWEERYC
jgi:peptide deformylase